jgi:hypothetical protein
VLKESTLIRLKGTAEGINRNPLARSDALKESTVIRFSRTEGLNESTAIRLQEGTAEGINRNPLARNDALKESTAIRFQEGTG